MTGPCTFNGTFRNLLPPNFGHEKWWVYIVTFVVIYVVCLGLSSLSYGIFYLVKKFKRTPNAKQDSGLLDNMQVTKKASYKKFHEFIRQLISGDTVSSKILISITFVCNLIYMILAVYRAYRPVDVEYCYTLQGSPERIVEVVVVLELLGFSFIRFLAANNIVLFWFDVYTIIDVLTLPHIFVSIGLGVDWLGLRTARFFWLTQLVTVIRFLPFIHSQDTIDVISLIVYFVVLLFFGTGIVHLLERSGDPWRMFANAVTDQEFFSYAYFIIVTITTVGYGDIFATTAFGRIFMVVYIIVGLAFFAALLPIIVEVASNFNAKRQYAKFDTTRVPRHVIVCGHITAFTAQEFLKDFLHPDRGDTHTHILFLHPARPDRDLKNVLRSYYTRVQYIIGSVLNGNDLERSKIFNSSAVFILADKYTNIPLEEDNANLLRLVSIKNTTTDITVIIQLLLSTSKKQVKNIEGWSPGRDIAVCLNELKLGLLSQSCMCPGFSTLIANLFYSSDFPALTTFDGPNAWKEGYIAGASNELYSTHFSPSFDGKNFQEAARVCYERLGLILLAFETPDGEVRRFYVNPSSKSHPGIVIKSGEEGTQGYFIGQDSDHVSIVNSFCEECDGNVRIDQHDRDKQVRKLVRSVTKRKCKCHSDLEEVTTNPLGQTELVDLNGDYSRRKSSAKIVLSSDDEETFEEVSEQFNIYQSDPVRLDDAILNVHLDFEEGASSTKPTLQDHIVLCVFADDKSPLLGLHNFLHPLRNKKRKESAKAVVIVSNRAFLKREWHLIRKIPDVYVVDGSPLRVKNLEQASVSTCSVCIVLTMLSARDDQEPAINDKEVVLCSLSLQKLLKKSARNQVKIITDLRQESNVQFLDFGDEDEPDERIYKAQPFACGEAFSVSMMDSVTSSAFHSPGTIYLVEDLIQASTTKTSCHVAAIPLNTEEYADKTFRDLYNLNLDMNNLVLGLYRKLPSADDDIFGNEHSEQRSSVSSDTFEMVKHYVVTAPDPETDLEPSDIAFVLINNSDTAEENYTKI